MLSNRLYTVTIIGAGVVGRTIGTLLKRFGLVEIHQICNATLSSAEKAVQYISAGSPVTSISKLDPVDIIFLATPEDVSVKLLSELSKVVMPDTLLIHFSGILKLSEFNVLRQSDIEIARLHPIKHMKSADSAIKTFNGTYCVYEGSEKYFALVEKLFSNIGAHIFKINEQNNYLYHAACVLASAYHQILLSASAVMYEECGMEKKSAIQLSKFLAQSAIESIDIDATYNDFVEGPIKRADLDTIEKNLDSISNHSIKELYASLGQHAVSLTEHENIVKKSLNKKLRLIDETAI